MSHHNLNSNINIDPTVERKLSPSLAIGGVVGKLCQYSKGTGPTSLKEMLEEYASWDRSNQEYDDDEVADFLDDVIGKKSMVSKHLSLCEQT